ncbi:spondin domain-containing protein [Shewanella sp. UCD-KL12]|uniref:spondin domain-containing protein n=1 Tax=Shewanella sp. UCD-KL12 TaxID=1917163 RepID=UPI000970CA4F|nr:spondin domain-containing protein [Shewanella sp. UCD-KL12]
MSIIKAITHQKFVLPIALTSLLTLSACSDNDTDSMPTPEPTPAPTPTQDYRVTVTNLTADQPMSPIALIRHQTSFSPWRTGETSSLALETLAESGDSAEFANIEGVDALVTGDTALAPGMKQSFDLMLTEGEIESISVLTMLVNTNDAFTGVNSFSLNQLAIDEIKKMNAIAYDAGTEANSEEKGSIPGPVDGGEGFNAMRDDVDRVHAHPGVISVDDGLSDSVLSASHRFDNPVLAISIERLK